MRDIGKLRVLVAQDALEVDIVFLFRHGILAYRQYSLVYVRQQVKIIDRKAHLWWQQIPVDRH